MKTFRLHLWREWREHRATLLFLAVALPLLSGLAALRLPRRLAGDPWMACSLIALYVAVVLAAVGGELLGRERRGPGLRWLERLPGSLGQAFAAKLGLHLATSALAGLAGFAFAQALAWLRGGGDFEWTNELRVTLPLVATLSAWTFACSAWALRGGTAILAAGLVLGLSGYPIGHVLLEGYRPSTTELVVATFLVVLAGLGSGALAFLLGSRRGRGAGSATAFGILPMLPLVVLAGTWSLDRLEQRNRLDPAAGDLTLFNTWVTEDGKTAFVEVQHRDPRWGGAMPVHLLQVDLTSGEWSSLVRDLAASHVISSPRENGLLRPSALVLGSSASPEELVLSLIDGGRTERFKDRTSWHPVGLGQWHWRPELAEGVYFDPFRKRTYPESEIEGLVEQPLADLFICPARWLFESEERWYCFDPDTRAREPLDLPRSAELLALLPDGRALFEHFEAGVVCVDPATGVVKQVLGPAKVKLIANSWALRAPVWPMEVPMPSDGPVFLSSEHGRDWYVLDVETMTLRPVRSPSTRGWPVASSSGRVLMRIDDSLGELDLESGAYRTLFPSGPGS